MQQQYTYDSLISQGDMFYQSQLYTTAFTAFSSAIKKVTKLEKNKRAKQLKSLFAKRSLCCLRLNDYKKCLQDVQCSLRFNSNASVDADLQDLKTQLIYFKLKTDHLLTPIPEEDPEETEAQFNIEPDIFFKLDEAQIFDSSDEDDDDEDDGNESATLEDLIDEYDLNEIKNITIESVIEKLKMIEEDSDNDEDGSDSTLTASTLKHSFSDDNEDSNFISDFGEN